MLILPLSKVFSRSAKVFSRSPKVFSRSPMVRRARASFFAPSEGMTTMTTKRSPKTIQTSSRARNRRTKSAKYAPPARPRVHQSSVVRRILNLVLALAKQLGIPRTIKKKDRTKLLAGLRTPEKLIDLAASAKEQFPELLDLVFDPTQARDAIARERSIAPVLTALDDVRQRISDWASAPRAKAGDGARRVYKAMGAALETKPDEAAPMQALYDEMVKVMKLGPRAPTKDATASNGAAAKVTQKVTETVTEREPGAPQG